jgi:thiamine pyrophosphate-dependent acetolactate synthase large subunit-like protein
MLDRPASTLLHLGPGLANGLANIHNAKRAGVGHGQRDRRARDRAPEV